MTDSVQNDIHDLKKGQDTIMEILDGMTKRQDGSDSRMDRFEASVEKRFDQVERRFDRVMTALDGIAGKLDDRKKEEAATTMLMGAHATHLVDLDKRVTKLEKAAV
jgi:hypothetical protein